VQAEPKLFFKLGEFVRLTKTPFAGIEDIYQMADNERRVMALIEILSKPLAMCVSVAPASWVRRAGKLASLSSLAILSSHDCVVPSLINE